MIRKLITVMLTCVSFIVEAQVNIITTIAGTSVRGYNGDGQPATAAQLYYPEQICLDRDQNIYIADAANQRIRKISAITREITTVAGTGVGGYSGDNGLAIIAEMNAPQAITIDNVGNIYVADGLNRRIRKIEATSGVISTITGTGVVGNSGDNGPAIYATVNVPSGLCTDKFNNLYFADFHNNNVRKIDATTGVITTVAGSLTYGYAGDNGLATNAQLNGPFDVSVDSIGNLFFTDAFNSAVRRVDYATGIITTIAGGVSGYSGDNFDATDAKMLEPTGIFMDKQYNIYVSEHGNGTIRKITGTGVTESGEITGVITTVAGKGVIGFGGDGGPATNAKMQPDDIWVDDYGNLIIADYENHRIRKVNNALKVNDLNKVDVISLYPNPTDGKFTVKAAANESTVTVLNMSGVQVYMVQSHTAKTDVDISNQPSGQYLVYVQCGDDKYVSKVLVR
jgi:sugar lactone lactonase YvrE